MPLPAPTTAMTCRASSFSAGMRLSLASSSSQYSMSNASCCGQRDVLVDRLRAAHDLDRAVVELRRHARFALVLAPGDHAHPGDEDARSGSHRASRASSGACTLVIGRSVVLAVLLEAVGELLAFRSCRTPVAGFQSTYSGLILVRRKWSGHDRAELGQARRVVDCSRRRSDRSRHPAIVPMKRFCVADLDPAAKGRICHQRIAALHRRTSDLILRAAERLVVARLSSDISRRDTRMRLFRSTSSVSVITLLVVIRPTIDEAMLAHHDG